MINTDPIDERLIALLMRDPQSSSEELAKQLSVSVATVGRRLKKLKESKALSFVAVPHPRLVGANVVVMIALKVDRDKMAEVLKVVARRPECRWATTTTGRFDILTMFWFRSNDELSNFIEQELAKVPGIRDSETFISLHAAKSGLIQQD